MFTTAQILAFFILVFCLTTFLRSRKYSFKVTLFYLVSAEILAIGAYIFWFEPHIFNQLVSSMWQWFANYTELHTAIKVVAPPAIGAFAGLWATRKGWPLAYGLCFITAAVVAAHTIQHFFLS